MKSITRLLKFIVIILITLISLIPFYVLLVLAFNPPSTNLSGKLNFAPKLYFNNFYEAWNKSHIGTAIFNSLIITFGAIIVIVVFASCAGYAIARFKNRFHRVIFNIFLICMMIPGIINTVPLYSLMHSIGGINTYWAMILICACNALPFSVFLYTNFVKSLPTEIEEAAVIDGCTKFSAFWRVTFPLLKPVTSAVVIISGLGVWNNYAQATFFLQSQSKRTIPLAISMFFQQYGAKWNLMAASAVIGVAPAIITFIVFQKYFIKGITAGSVKG